jgi:hypothetical protein
MRSRLGKWEKAATKDSKSAKPSAGSSSWRRRVKGRRRVMAERISGEVAERRWRWHGERNSEKSGARIASRDEES